MIIGLLQYINVALISFSQIKNGHTFFSIAMNKFNCLYANNVLS